MRVKWTYVYLKCFTEHNLSGRPHLDFISILFCTISSAPKKVICRVEKQMEGKACVAEHGREVWPHSTINFSSGPSLLKFLFLLEVEQIWIVTLGYLQPRCKRFYSHFYSCPLEVCMKTKEKSIEVKFVSQEIRHTFWTSTLSAYLGTVTVQRMHIYIWVSDLHCYFLFLFRKKPFYKCTEHFKGAFL